MIPKSDIASPCFSLSTREEEPWWWNDSERIMGMSGQGPHDQHWHRVTSGFWMVPRGARFKKVGIVKQNHMSLLNILAIRLITNKCDYFPCVALFIPSVTLKTLGDQTEADERQQAALRHPFLTSAKMILTWFSGWGSFLAWLGLNVGLPAYQTLPHSCSCWTRDLLTSQTIWDVPLIIIEELMLIDSINSWVPLQNQAKDPTSPARQPHEVAFAL